MEISNYYFARLDLKEQSAYQILSEAMARGEESVRLPSLSGDSVREILRAIRYERPDLFFVDFKHISYTQTPLSVTAHPRYRIRGAALDSTREKVRREMDRILAAAGRASPRSEQGKCRWVHNYLIKNVHYQTEAMGHSEQFPEAFSIDGVFLNHAAVCEGIAKAFQILCRRLGVSVMIVSGAASAPQIGEARIEQAHAWNIASIQGRPVHIDATWDNNLSVSSRRARYDYFCVPDVWIRQDHIFQAMPPCTAAEFSYFAAQGVCFSSPRQLKAYLKDALEKRSEVLYFKLIGDNLPADVVGRTDSIVKQALEQFTPGSYRMELIFNPGQFCFFYRISQ